MTAMAVRFVSDESGQDLIEYGLLIGLITAAAITVIGSLSTWVTTAFTGLHGRLP